MLGQSSLVAACGLNQWMMKSHSLYEGTCTTREAIDTGYLPLNRHKRYNAPQGMNLSEFHSLLIYCAEYASSTICRTKYKSLQALQFITYEKTV